MRLHRKHAAPWGARGASPHDEDLATPAGRGAARVARQRERIAAEERREPLRRRILMALGDAASSPTALAALVEAEPESVSRLLGRLRQDGLVSAEHDPDDRRRRRYRLTPEGEIELRSHRAFGEPPSPPAALPPEAGADFLDMALDSAIDARRKTNRLDDAAARLRVIVEQAQRWEARGLAVDAMAELATTLRQARRLDDVTELLDALKAISLGRDGASDASLALPAAAHREYALGRLSSSPDGADPVSRARHLVSAETLFRQLSYSAPPDTASRWRQRRAWSTISLAANMREQSRLEEALEQARQAMALFEELDDAYGRSRCFFMIGFCLRLMGDFDMAWVALQGARDLASQNAYERFQADSIMQMGEVRRCQGELAEARELLDEATERARRMDMLLTEAFARSALGAVEYDEQRLDEALATLDCAQELFERCGHAEGLALNERRRGYVAGRLHRVNQADESTVQRLIMRARVQYEQLRSPAGITACDVEIGRLELVRTGRASHVVAQISGRLGDTRQRNLIELDPWVPRILADFAEDAQDEALHDQARQLLAAAGRRLETVRVRAADAIGQVREHVGTHRAGASEMGGETRSELHQAA